MSNRMSTMITLFLAIVIIIAGLILPNVLGRIEPATENTTYVPKTDPSYMLETDEPLSFYPLNIYKRDKAIPLKENQKKLLKDKQVDEFLLGLLAINNFSKTDAEVDEITLLINYFKYFRFSPESPGFYVFESPSNNYPIKMDCVISEEGDIIYFKSNINTVPGKSRVTPADSTQYLKSILNLCNNGSSQTLLYNQIKKTDLSIKPDYIKTTISDLYVYTAGNSSLVIFADNTGSGEEICGFTVQ